jgi:hypothetical protein
VFHVRDEIPALATIASDSLDSPPDETLVASSFSSSGSIYKCLAAITSPRVTFYVDSGAGQSLCSVGSAFTDLQPCRIS